MKLKAKHWAMIAILVVVLLIFWVRASKAEYEIQGLGFDETPAEVVIVEYGDFQCPACGSLYPNLRDVKKKYDTSQLRVDFKHFPIRQIHPFAQKAAEAAECARDQDRFWDMHDLLFDNQRDLRVPSLKKYAQELELDTEAFNACLDSGAMAPRIEGNFKEGVAANVRATPTMFVNGDKVEGVQSVSSLEDLIDARLE